MARRISRRITQSRCHPSKRRSIFHLVGPLSSQSRRQNCRRSGQLSCRRNQQIQRLVVRETNGDACMYRLVCIVLVSTSLMSCSQETNDANNRDDQEMAQPGVASQGDRAAPADRSFLSGESAYYIACGSCHETGAERCPGNRRSGCLVESIVTLAGRIGGSCEQGIYGHARQGRQGGVVRMGRNTCDGIYAVPDLSRIAARIKNKAASCLDATGPPLHQKNNGDADHVGFDLICGIYVA